MVISYIKYQDTIKMFLSVCELKGLSKNTIAYYEQRLRFFKDWITPAVDSPADTTTQHIRDYISDLQKKVSVTTVNHSICSLSAFFNYLEDEGYIEVNPMHKIKKVRAARKIIQAFSDEQVKELLGVLDRSRFSGIRDYTLMILLLDTGLRISEALGLRIGDLSIPAGTAVVTGKGNKQRIVIFGNKTRRTLTEYIARRGDDLETDMLFVSEFGEPIKIDQVDENFRRYGERAQVSGVRVSPHTFRHTFARNWIISGGDPFSLQHLLGHTSLEVTRRYVQLATSNIQAAHTRVSPVDKMDGMSAAAKSGRKRLR